VQDLIDQWDGTGSDALWDGKFGTDLIRFEQSD
jgi:hypothetical protein